MNAENAEATWRKVINAVLCHLRKYGLIYLLFLVIFILHVFVLIQSLSIWTAQIEFVNNSYINESKLPQLTTNRKSTMDKDTAMKRFVEKTTEVLEALNQFGSVPADHPATAILEQWVLVSQLCFAFLYCIPLRCIWNIKEKVKRPRIHIAERTMIIALYGFFPFSFMLLLSLTGANIFSTDIRQYIPDLFFIFYPCLLSVLAVPFITGWRKLRLLLPAMLGQALVFLGFWPLVMFAVIRLGVPLEVTSAQGMALAAMAAASLVGFWLLYHSVRRSLLITAGPVNVETASDT